MLFLPNRAFFIIDSRALEDVRTELFGYTFVDGKVIESAESLSGNDPSCNGSYVYIKRDGSKIVIKQDFMGSYGMCLYQHNGRFVVSNSFEYLVEYLSNTDGEMTINEDYANHLIVCDVCSSSYKETLMNEITVVPRNSWLEIDTLSKSITLHDIDYKEGTVDIDSPEALDILDGWYEKWTSSIRNLVNSGERVTADLSGGFDSRLTFALFLGANIDLNMVKIHSLNDGLHTHAEDWEIANDIANYFNFDLNGPDPRYGKYETKVFATYSNLERATMSYYLKNGFHKQMHYPSTLCLQRWNTFSGNGGENLRDYWDMPMQDLYEKKLFQCDKFPLELSKLYKKSLIKILDRSFDDIRAKHDALGRPISEKELPRQLFKETYSRYHFGKAQMENYYGSRLYWSPLLDSEPYKINLKPHNWDDTLILFAVIFDRYQPDLLRFNFEGGRGFSDETLAFAHSINERKPYIPNKHISSPTLDYIPSLEGKIDISAKKLIEMNDGFINGSFDCEEVIKSYEKRQIEGPSKSLSRLDTDNRMAEISRTNFFTGFMASSYGADEYIRLEERMRADTYFPNSVFNTYMANYLARKAAEGEGAIPSLTDFFETAWDSPKRALQPSLLTDPKLQNFAIGRIDIKNLLDSDKLPGLRMVSVESGYMHSAKPDWMASGKNKGYQFDGYSGEAHIMMECLQEGELKVSLRGPDVRNPKKKPIVYVIDFLTCEINGEVVLDKRTPVTHNKPLVFKRNVTKGEPVEVIATWAPHNGSVSKSLENKKKKDKKESSQAQTTNKPANGRIGKKLKKLIS